MGNEPVQISASDSIDAYKRIINTRYGYNPDGTMPTDENAEGGMMKYAEYGMWGLGVGMPVVAGRKTIANVWENRSWQGVQQAYKTGWQQGTQTLRNPINHGDLRFVDSGLNKVTGILAKNTPAVPKAVFQGHAPEIEQLYNRLLGAKNPKEYSDIVKQFERTNKGSYKKLKNVLKNAKLQDEFAKLQRLPKYHEIYDPLLKDFQTAEADLKVRNQRPSGNASVDNLHRRINEAQLKENEFLKTLKKQGKKVKTLSKLSKTTKTMMSASKGLRSISRGVGKVGGVLMIALSAVGAVFEGIAAYGVGKAEEEQAKAEGKPLSKGHKWKQVGKQVLKSVGKIACELGGAAIGEWAGAAIGQVLIPIPGVGAAIGGFVGSMLGFVGGSALAESDWFGDKIGIKKSVADEYEEKQKKETETARDEEIAEVEKAVNDNDLESLYAYQEGLMSEVEKTQLQGMSEDQQKAYMDDLKKAGGYVTGKVAEAQKAIEEAEAEKRKIELLNQAWLNFSATRDTAEQDTTSHWGTGYSRSWAV